MWSSMKSGSTLSCSLRAASCVVASFAFALGSGRAEPVLCGVAWLGTEVRFCVRADEVESARWLKLGDRVAGYSIVAWNEVGESLTLRDGKRVSVIRLPAEHVREEGPERLEQRRQRITENLRRLAEHACEHLIAQRTDYVRSEDLVGPEKSIYGLETADGETYGNIEFALRESGLEFGPAEGPRVTLNALEGLFIRICPTQSLAAVSKSLHIPLPHLVALNPTIVSERPVTEMTRIRLN
jgi:hypothetical protein